MSTQKQKQQAQIIHNWLNGHDDTYTEEQLRPVRRYIHRLKGPNGEIRTLSVVGARFMAEHHYKYKGIENYQ